MFFLQKILMPVVALLIAGGLYWAGLGPAPTTADVAKTIDQVLDAVQVENTTTTSISIEPPRPTTTTGLNALVTRVVDGDTLEAQLDGQTEIVKVRLLGVNTPETVDPRRPVQCFGKEASAFSKKTLEHQRVRLLPDPEADELDKYGRLLRNVYLADGRWFNLLLVQEGYANAYVSFPQNAAAKRDLRRAETEAKIAQKGLWSPTACPK